jgi:tetratricopeptide (TPR) repeat protein
LEIAERIASRRLIAQALAMRAEAMAHAGDVAVARTLVQRALDLARAEHDRLAEIEALRLRGCIEGEAGDRMAAQASLDEALAAAREIQHPWAQATVLKDLGDLHLRRGAWDAAARAFTEAAQSYSAIGAQVRADDMRARAREASGAAC